MPRYVDGKVNIMSRYYPVLFLYKIALYDYTYNFFVPPQLSVLK